METGQNVTLRHSIDSLSSSISYYKRQSNHIGHLKQKKNLQIDLFECQFSLQKIRSMKIVLPLMNSPQMLKNKDTDHFLDLILLLRPDNNTFIFK
jgi:hypothetical protein